MSRLILPRAFRSFGIEFIKHDETIFGNVFMQKNWVVQTILYIFCVKRLKKGETNEYLVIRI